MTIFQEHIEPRVHLGEDDVTVGPFRTLHLAPDDWLIHDTRHPDNDARHLVACLRRRDSGRIEALWLCGADLPADHADIRAAVECVAAWSAHRSDPV